MQKNLLMFHRLHRGLIKYYKVLIEMSMKLDLHGKDIQIFHNLYREQMACIPIESELRKYITREKRSETMVCFLTGEIPTMRKFKEN